MFLIRTNIFVNLKSPVLRCYQFRNCNVYYKTKMYNKVVLLNTNEKVNELIKKCAPKIIYNSVIEEKLYKYGYRNNFPLKLKQENEESIIGEPVPLALKYLSEDIVIDENTVATEIESKGKDETLIHFPYKQSYTVGHIDQIEPQNVSETSDVASEANEEVRRRHELQKEMKNWMVAYDNYDDKCLNDEDSDLDVDDWKVNYGTPDHNSKISNIPCGGCGALLHCKDTAIPGYIPSEIFKHKTPKGGACLEAIICQRCHFLKHYNVALQVSISPEYYPKVLSTISNKQGLVVLMVDLLDFPCSIWPGIGEIFGHKTPIVVVGNKVDLLPQDGKNFLQRIRTNLLEYVKLQGFTTFNIKDVVLISAKTGFGVEDLITRLCSLYRQKGDVYIVGCTNVGKSSLFNALLQSDYCKVQAMDLIQRATISVWPGTTLNLLKFPIKRPIGYRQYLRNQRLQNLQELMAQENRLRKEQLRVTKDPKYAALIGHIGVTQNASSLSEIKDNFSIQGRANAAGILKMGINEKSKEYAYSKWCFDTPGVVQPDQIIHLLTTEELLLTLPKQLILPRSFCLKPKSSLFIAGLSRLDYVDGPESVKLTVFTSNELPITVCDMDDAEEIYRELLGSDLFKVPTGNLDRISKWPCLELAQNFTITGEHWHQSAKDVVLSSSGWVAIAGRAQLKYKFQAWTPEKRGVYIRDCLLPHAVALAGKRINRSVAYNKYKFYLK